VLRQIRPSWREIHFQRVVYFLSGPGHFCRSAAKAKRGGQRQDWIHKRFFILFLINAFVHFALFERCGTNLNHNCTVRMTALAKRNYIDINTYFPCCTITRKSLSVWTKRQPPSTS
jgi:hypothetical protein